MRTPLAALCLVATLAGPAAAQTWYEQAAPMPSAATAKFGSACARSGDTVAVGAEDYSGEFYNGGAVFIYERDAGGPGAWGEVALITGSFTGDNKKFGSAVDLEGDTLVVGQNARVYFFERDATDPHVWNQLQTIVVQGAPVGTHLALDGDRLVGASELFERDGTGVWSHVGPLPMAGVLDGDTLVAGDLSVGGGSGAAFVFERDAGGPGNWGLTQQLLSPNPQPFGRFGSGVAISGDTIVVGARVEASPAGIPGSVKSGTAYVFERDLGGPGTWGVAAQLQHPDPAGADWFGDRVALAGDVAAVAATTKNIGYDAGVLLGLAYDPNSDSVFAIDDPYQGPGGQLLELEPGSGFGALLGAPGPDALLGLAHDPATGVLYATEQDGALWRLDPATGMGTAIGPLGFPLVAGLAWDPRSHVLYGTEVLLDVLVRIDPETGAGTVVGPLGFLSVGGLAFDTSTETLYGWDGPTGALIEVDPLTGAGTLIATPGFPSPTHDFQGLAYDARRDRLIGVALEALFEVDRATGVHTLIGGTRVVNAGAVYLFERAGSAWTPGQRVALSSLSNNHRAGLALSLEGPDLLAGGVGQPVHVIDRAPTVAYCTAGTSSSGCLALLSASGTASASLPSGFELVATDVEGARDGLFYFGVNGRQAVPWGNGSSLQCVAPPVARGGVLASTGTSGACDGGFAQDLNTLWSSSPAMNPGAAATVQAQLWYRDPLNTSNSTTSLSDALEFSVMP